MVFCDQHKVGGQVYALEGARALIICISTLTVMDLMKVEPDNNIIGDDMPMHQFIEKMSDILAW